MYQSCYYDLGLNNKIKHTARLAICCKFISPFFGGDKSVIFRHIKNVILENNIDINKVVAKNANAGNDRNTFIVLFYNLDVIISLGYKVHSQNIIIFRKMGMQKIGIHDTYIDAVIPFNKDIVSQVSSGKNDCKNDGKNLFNNDLTKNEKRVLSELINNPNIPYDTLVVELKISRRTVSRVFESLVKKWYIQRVE